MQSENETSFDGSRMTDGQNHSSETDQKGDVDFGGGKDVIPISTLHGRILNTFVLRAKS